MCISLLLYLNLPNLWPPRPTVHVLSGGPGEAGGEDGRGVLPQGQIPNPAGTVCRRCHRSFSYSSDQPEALPLALICCVVLRFTALTCTPMTQRSTWPCAAARWTTIQRCMGTGVCVCVCGEVWGPGTAGVHVHGGNAHVSPPGCWTLSNVRITAAEDKIATVGTTTRQQDTRSSTKYGWIWALWG